MPSRDEFGIELVSDTKFIMKSFQLAEDEFIPNGSSLAEFRLELIRIIAELLERDMTRLMNSLYRIDVAEEKVKLAFAGKLPVAEALSDLIIERELQKIAFRKKYS